MNEQELTWSQLTAGMSWRQILEEYFPDNPDAHEAQWDVLRRGDMLWADPDTLWLVAQLWQREQGRALVYEAMRHDKMSNVERDAMLARIAIADFATVRAPILTSLDTVTGLPVEWLWWPYLPLGMLSMLDGDPGLGKSLLTVNLAACLSRGDPLPNQQGKPTLPVGGCQTTLLLSAEDSAAYTIKPRLEQAQADCRRVHLLTGWVGHEGEEQLFTLAHMDVLHAAIEQVHPRLVIIDPIQAYLGSIDMHRANETRPLMQALSQAAARHHCTILAVRHPSKGSTGSKAIHRGLGSVDMIGAARTALFVEAHPGDMTKSLLAQSKSNIGPHGRSYVFSKAEGQFAWCGVTRLTAEHIGGSSRGPDPWAFLSAVLWLEDHLQSGIPQPSEDVLAQGEEAGHSQKTLRRAKKMLAVRSIRTKDQQWVWSLPTLSLLQQPLSLGYVSNKGKEGLLDPLKQNQYITEDILQDDSEVHVSQDGQDSQGVRTQAPEDARVADSMPTCRFCFGDLWQNDDHYICDACHVSFSTIAFDEEDTSRDT